MYRTEVITSRDSVIELADLNDGNRECNELQNKKIFGMTREQVMKIVQASVIALLIILALAAILAFMYGVMKSNAEYDMGQRSFSHHDAMAISGILSLPILGVVGVILFGVLERKRKEMRLEDQKYNFV